MDIEKFLKLLVELYEEQENLEIKYDFFLKQDVSNS